MSLLACHRHLLVYSLVANDNDELESQLVIVLGFFLTFFSYVVEDNNKPKGSSSFLGFFSSCVEDDDELGSQPIVVFGCFASVAKDDDKPKGSFSSLCFFSHV